MLMVVAAVGGSVLVLGKRIARVAAGCGWYSGDGLVEENLRVSAWDVTGDGSGGLAVEGDIRYTGH
jgi:hypothetical protein